MILDIANKLYELERENDKLKTLMELKTGGLMSEKEKTIKGELFIYGADYLEKAAMIGNKKLGEILDSYNC